MKKQVVIRASKNGPYIVTDLEHIVEAVASKVKTTGSTVALCRCGESKTKPYCDGTHMTIGFSDEKKEGRQARVSESYAGKVITIHDDRGICSHAGYCTDGLPNVFRMATEPWIDPDAETVEKIIETIRKCPSGALSYSIDGVKYDSFSEGEQIKLTENGPYRVSGSVSLEDNDLPESTEHYTLCRCGHSKNKPFCDGQHWYAKFVDDGKVK